MTAEGKMRIRSTLLLVLSGALAFAPASRPVRVGRPLFSTQPAGIMEAFADVKRAAELFKPGSEGSEKAKSIIDALETATYDSWQRSVICAARSLSPDRFET